MLALLLAACGMNGDVSIMETPEDEWPVQKRLGLTDEQVGLILDFLNDCDTSFELLDGDVGLASDAASNLVDWRDGKDGRCGGEDDAPYLTLDEVDEVPEVGDATILTILEYLEGGSDPEKLEWEGVSFTQAEVDAVLEIANEASESVLDVDVDLPSNTVASIIDARPHPDMDHLAETPDVGPSALEKLKAYVPSWTR